MATPSQQINDTDAPRRKFLLLCPGREFVVPYVERELGDGWQIVTRLADADDAERAVLLSSTEIYTATQGSDIDETSPIDVESSWHGHERMYQGLCQKLGLRPLILRCANVVGTGMTGLPMDLARGIARGTVCHIATPRAKKSTRLRPNPDAPDRPHGYISVVHAVDVARAAVSLSLPERQNDINASAGIFNLTDGVETDIDTLIDALAHRIKDKRVGDTSLRWLKWLTPGNVYRAMTTTRTYSAAKYLKICATPPVTVTDYLMTHIYDETSL